MTDDARTRRLRELLAKWRGYMDPTAEIYADQLAAVLDTEGDRPMHDQEYYDKSRRINMGLEPAEGDASPAPPYRPQRSFYEITEAMLTYGGGFVHNLAVALRSADETNKRILVLAFQDYWRTYDEMAGMPRPDPPVQP